MAVATVTVTQHAVQRYAKRAPDADHIDTESLRSLMKKMAEEAIVEGRMLPHPTDKERRIIPFKVGDENLHFILGPNLTTHHGDWALIGVIYDKEQGGKQGVGAVVGDLFSEETRKALSEKVAATPKKKARFLVRIASTKETYEAVDLPDLIDLLTRRQPNPDDVEVFERCVVDIRREYSLGPLRRAE